VLTDHNRRSPTVTTALGALSLLGTCSLDPHSAQAQDRVLAAFAELTASFSPRLASPSPSIRSTFERTIAEGPGLPDQLRAALHDSAILKITSGQLLPRNPHQAWEIELSDGTHLSFHLTTKPEFGVTKTGQLTVRDELHDCAIPVAAIRAIRPQRDLRYDPAWDERMAGQSLSDTIFIRKEHGVLDHLEGVALRFTKTHLEFEYDGAVLPIPYSKIEGVRMASRPHDEKTALNTTSSTLQTAHHTIHCKKLDLSQEQAPHLTIETPSGATLSVAPTPLTIDRTGMRALTARGLTIHTRRLPIEDWQLVSQSAARWPLAVSPSVMTITGKGLDTELMIQGPAEVEIDVPKGYAHLHFELEISGIPIAPVTFRYLPEGAESQTVLYQQPRFPEPEQLVNLTNKLHLSGPGKLLLHVPGEAQFRTFLLTKE